MKREEAIVRFDFGNAPTTADGWIKLDRVYRSPCYGFLRDTFSRWSPPALGTPFDDYLFNDQPFEFRLGLTPGTYGIKLHFYDPTTLRDEITVTLTLVDARTPEGAGRVIESHAVQPGLHAPAVLEIKDFHHTGGVLGIVFVSPSGGGIILNGMEVFALDGGTLSPIYTEAPSAVLPMASHVAALPDVSPEDCLRSLCDWLLTQRDADGFMGDFEGGKRLWYTASYPVRVLLAGHKLFGRQDWLDAALKLTDWFVDEQMPEGGFVQSVLGVRPSTLSDAELREIRVNNWMNLADIGSMVAALIAATHSATGDRRARYITAARKYLDIWASPRIQPDGGVRNGWLGGMGEAKNVYLVSTAMTALSMALFYGLTGEVTYLKKAEKSAALLLKDWSDDGSMRNWTFDSANPNEKRMPATYFGDTYYVYEGLAAVLRMTDDKALALELYAALKKTISGAEGLLADLGSKPWWNLDNCWNNSKSAGSLIVLQDFLHAAQKQGTDAALTEEVEQAYALMQKFITHNEYSCILGVMAEDPEDCYPLGPHSLHSWTGCAIAATGFAGIAVAQMIEYGVVYPARWDGK